MKNITPSAQTEWEQIEIEFINNLFPLFTRFGFIARAFFENKISSEERDALINDLDELVSNETHSLVGKIVASKRTRLLSHEYMKLKEIEKVLYTENGFLREDENVAIDVLKAIQNHRQTIRSVIHEEGRV